MPTYKGDEVLWYEDGMGGRYMYKIPTVNIEEHTVSDPLTVTLTADTVINADCIGSIFDARSKIENVIFNPPATIVLWSDGTKTVVKCQKGDEWDAEKGLAMAISKKYFYNKGRYNAEFQKWLSELV